VIFFKPPLAFGERHDFVESAFNLPARHPEDGAIEENVFASAKLRVEPSPHFQQAGHPSPDPDSAFCWFRDAAKDFKFRINNGI
jgi:hypothetical protein